MTPIRLGLVLVAACAATLVLPARASAHDDRYCREIAERPADDIEDALISPDLVFCNADSISLTTEQRRQIEALTNDTRHERRQREADLGHARRDFHQVLRTRPVSEAQALAALERVLIAERAIKRANLSLMLRTEAILTARQRAMLVERR